MDIDPKVVTDLINWATGDQGGLVTQEAAKRICFLLTTEPTLSSLGENCIDSDGEFWKGICERQGVVQTNGLSPEQLLKEMPELSEWLEFNSDASKYEDIHAEAEARVLRRSREGFGGAAEAVTNLLNWATGGAGKPFTRVSCERIRLLTTYGDAAPRKGAGDDFLYWNQWKEEVWKDLCDRVGLDREPIAEVYIEAGLEGGFDSEEILRGGPERWQQVVNGGAAVAVGWDHTLEWLKKHTDASKYEDIYNAERAKAIKNRTDPKVIDLIIWATGGWPGLNPFDRESFQRIIFLLGLASVWLMEPGHRPPFLSPGMGLGTSSPSNAKNFLGWSKGKELAWEKLVSKVRHETEMYERMDLETMKNMGIDSTEMLKQENLEVFGDYGELLTWLSKHPIVKEYEAITVENLEKGLKEIESMEGTSQLRENIQKGIAASKRMIDAIPRGKLVPIIVNPKTAAAAAASPEPLQIVVRAPNGTRFEAEMPPKVATWTTIFFIAPDPGDPGFIDAVAASETAAPDGFGPSGAAAEAAGGSASPPKGRAAAEEEYEALGGGGGKRRRKSKKRRSKKRRSKKRRSKQRTKKQRTTKRRTTKRRRR